MTASARLSNRPSARDAEVGPAGARPLRRATPTSSLPAPPAPVPPSAPPVRGHVAPPVHQRLRGAAVARVVAAATVTLAVVGGLGWIGQTPGPGVPAETTVIRVGAGETVWDVARRVAPKSDHRAVVERIRRLNGLAGSAVQPGQQLQVPDGR